MNEDISGNVHRKLYNKSDKLNSRCNRNNEFQDGYRIGVDSLGYYGNNVIEEERQLRIEVEDDLGSGFTEWQRGFWAARTQLITVGIKKRKQYGRYFGEKSDSV